MKRELNYLKDGTIIPDFFIGTFKIPDFASMDNVIKTSLDNNINGFDTSPSYGTSALLSEAILKNTKNFKEIKRKDLFIVNKVDPWQMQQKGGDISSFVKYSIKKMKIEYLDLLLIHWPIPQFLNVTWKSMEKLYRDGIVRSIGICNTRQKQLLKFLESDIEIIPHVIQIERHPLFCDNGIIKLHKENDIVTMAYSPLCRMDTEVVNSSILLNIAEKYKKSVAQIIMRWHFDHGIVPVFLSLKPHRIISNTDIYNFSLTPNEVEKIDSMHKDFKLFPESFGCPGF